MVATASVPLPGDEAADGTLRAPARTARRPAASGPGEATALSVALPAPDHAASRSRLLAARLEAAFAGASLLHARPKSMQQARAHHHEHAGHWTWPVVKWLRVAWGYGVHLPYRVLALALDEVLSSPAATVIVAALIFAFWRWH